MSLQCVSYLAVSLGNTVPLQVLCRDQTPALLGAFGLGLREAAAAAAATTAVLESLPARRPADPRSCAAAAAAAASDVMRYDRAVCERL